METITWKWQCFICKRPIHSGRPTLLFLTDRPQLVGICHSRCGYSVRDYALHQMCPPYYLSEEQLSFLMYFYPRLYGLPGGDGSNRELRWSLVRLLRDFPASLTDPIACLRQFVEEYKHLRFRWLYQGDLEADFLRFLGEVQRSAGEKLLGVEINFSRRVSARTAP